MKKLSMDCIGRQKETEDGYTAHILAIIDNFSRYVGLYPIKGASALDVAGALLTHIGTFGCPEIIQMDNGTEFTINEKNLRSDKTSRYFTSRNPCTL